MYAKNKIRMPIVLQMRKWKTQRQYRSMRLVCTLWVAYFNNLACDTVFSIRSLVLFFFFKLRQWTPDIMRSLHSILVSSFPPILLATSVIFHAWIATQVSFFMFDIVFLLLPRFASVFNTSIFKRATQQRMPCIGALGLVHKLPLDRIFGGLPYDFVFACLLNK